MKRIVGYVLKDKLGCFYDPKLKVFLRPGGEPVPVPKNKLAGTVMERWVSKGSILPVYEDVPEVPSAPVMPEVSPDAPVAADLVEELIGEIPEAKPAAAKRKVAIPRKRK